MAWKLRWIPTAKEEFDALRVFDARIIVAAIKANLTFQPNVESENRKMLEGLVAPWTSDAPTWELRVRAFRVFYDLDEESQEVRIRAVRRKTHGVTTEEIL